MAQKAAIKSRIKSVNATKKITGAMKLIATVKLQKQRNLMYKNREYTNVLSNTLANILSGNIEVESSYLQKKDNSARAVIVFCSDLGLCGGYNINLQKLADRELKNDDYLFVVGSKNFKYLHEKFNVVNELIDSDNITYLDLKKLADEAIQMYKEDKVGSISILFTEFVNNVTFNPVLKQILPCDKDKYKTDTYKEVLLEPNPKDILNNLIPMVIENEVYARWLEAKVSEQGARRFAMENATDNADELTEELLLQYNQARQAAITQEITEIVGGADAL